MAEAEWDALRAALRAFVDEREWSRFHHPKDLALSLSVEAAELLELFQWRAADEPLDDERRARVGEELADVLMYAMLLADRADIDLLAATRAKLEANRAKYPVAKARGRSDKYDRL